jgi:hypothetical protein
MPTPLQIHAAPHEITALIEYHYARRSTLRQEAGQLERGETRTTLIEAAERAQARALELKGMLQATECETCASTGTTKDAPRGPCPVCGRRPLL